MKIRLKELNAWANGEITYVKEETYDVDKRFAAELLETGKFEEVKTEKTVEKVDKKESK